MNFKKAYLQITTLYLYYRVFLNDSEIQTYQLLLYRNDVLMPPKQKFNHEDEE